ncbi:MAG TPA: M50 family metallopeptidase [Candidatus Paceibacterota bacterium]|nr:M50 family metallopeptidase [Candidatus Paceibacterota bacterium]
MTIAIAIFTIGILVILHELGHFFAAKKFGVKVEEFGIGLPPRLWGKQIGETIYSVNALPIGGFVRMEGEEKRSESPRSFNKKPVWQRLVIVGGGVFVFWVIAAAIFAGLGATVGIPMAIDDNAQGVADPRVQIIGIASNSPAAEAGIVLGDTILRIQGQEITKMQEVRGIATTHAGQEITLEVRRGTETLQINLTPRIDPPEGEGAIGVAFVRTGMVHYAWWQAPFRGIAHTAQLTVAILRTFADLISGLVAGQGLPPGTQFSGPIGVVGFLSDSLGLGVSSFLSFVALISVYLAIFNTLPIPALDGGRMFFLLVEAVRRRPLPEKIEQRLIITSFIILIALIIWISIGDVRNRF